MRKTLAAVLVVVFMLLAVASGEGVGVETLFSGAIDVSGITLFATPEGVCVDEDGLLYVFDTANQLVYTYAGGAFERVAGSGSLKGGYSDEKALDSRFNGCSDGAFTVDGKLIILDKHNHIVRALIDGEMFTFSGSAIIGYAEGNRRVAKYNLPCGLATEGYNVYVSDTLNHCVRLTNGLGDVNLFAGVPTQSGYKDGPVSEALFCEPIGIALDGNGAIYVCDSGNQRIRKIENGMVTTVAGGGDMDAETGYMQTGFVDGMDARFNFPAGLCYANGVLYIADAGNHAVRALYDTGEVVTVAGTGKPGYVDGAEAQFNAPTDIAYFGGYLYIADSLNAAVRVMPAP